MATQARFTAKGRFSNNDATGFAAAILTASGDYTGAGANNALVFTADSVNGGRVVGLHFEAIGTNTQSVARVYVNNGSANTTATNNILAGKLTLPATTASNTVAEATADFYFPGGFADLDPGFRIYVGLGTTVAAGWVVTPILGGEY